MQLRYFPVSLNIAGKNVLVVGGGRVGENKIKKLLKYGAKIKVIALEFTKNILRLADTGKLIIKKREYKCSDLEQVVLVIAATSDKKINKTIWADAKKRNIWVNVVDDKKICEFISPAVIRKKGLVIAITTDGKNPKLSREFRIFLEGKIDEFNIDRYKS